MGAEKGKKDIVENPRTHSRVFSLALTLVVLMSGAFLPQRLSLIEAAWPAPPQTNYSSAAGDIITPRATASATLLPNGKVLIACGYGTFGSQLSGPLNSAELYDPVTGTWSSTGNLSTTHGGEEFTTTLLQNGKVLIVGGSPGFGALNSAELYDSATETWSLTGNLIQGRAYHAATLLPNGEVLVVGGENGGILSSAELYNPATGTWRPTGHLNFARSYHTATLLPNGKVLVVEGYGAGTTAELYDPATGTWSPTGNLSKSYYWHTTTLLPKGKVLVVGSLYFGTNKTTELYDPASGTWTVTGSLNFGRLYHTATLLSNGKVLVLGGSDRPSSTVYDRAELYDPSTGTWTLAGNLNISRVGHTATMLRNGQVLVAGGWNGSGLLRSTELYDAGADSSTNPVDDARFFVRQHYLDFLNREPDQGGWDYWTHQITECNANQLCINSRRVAVSDAFFFELEYQQTGAYVFRLYRAAYGNNQPFPNPDKSNETESKKLPSYAVFVSDRARVVGGGNLAQSQLDLANVFVGRPEFLAKYPADLDGPRFVDAVLHTIQSDSGMDLSSQRDALINLFNSGGRGTVMYRLADDNVQTNPINNRTFIDAEYNHAFVATEYFGYLRRDPDIAGFLFWLEKVNRFPIRNIDIQHAMVCAFITSAEYQQRFSPLVTHTNAECGQ
jgi:N-acetylneuraminic acid mutarotase